MSLIENPYPALLPGWSKTYRTILLVLDGISLFFLAFMGVGYLVISASAKGMEARTSLGLVLVVFAVVFGAFAIPYLLANIVYGIIWLSSLRGKGYISKAGSSVFLVAAPLIVIASMLAFFFWPRY